MFSTHPLYTEDIDNILKLNIQWNALDGAKVCIIGATGMIGTVIADTIMALNERSNACIDLWIMVRDKNQAITRFRDYIGSKNFHVFVNDVNNGINANISFDYILHCASNTHPLAYSSDPIGTIMTNIIGTYHVLEYARKISARRVMFLSSVEIYGENRGDTESFSENYCGYIDCNTLRAGYPEGKRAGEALCQAYRAAYGMNIVIPRISRVYGPTMRMTDSKALSQFIKKAINHEDIVLKSTGEQLFSYCYVADAASALMYILLIGADGEAYNVAGPDTHVRLKDIAAFLAQQNGKEVRFEIPNVMEARGYSKAQTAILDTDKLATLGWKAMYSMKDGLERTIKILSRD